MESTLKFLLVIFLLVCLRFYSCTDEYSKEDYLGTISIGSGVYSEYYRIDSYGVGGDVYTFYVTDSLSFRKLVDRYYDSESWKGEMDGDFISFVKFRDVGGLNGTKMSKKKVKDYVFKYSELVSSGTME